MKLLDIETEILAAVTLQADATVAEIARELGVRPHRCRHALDRMLERGIVSRRVVVNPARLGYRVFGLWFSLSPRIAKDGSKLISFLESSPHVSYLGEFSGDHEWRIDILARSLTEADETIGQISRMREEVFSERRLAETISVFDFPLKTASRRRRAITPRQTSIFVDLEQPEVSLKETDLMILRELTIDGNQSQANLARKLKMPVSTLGFRINQLREKQVIVGYHLLPGVETLQGYELSFRVHRIRLRQVGTRARAQLCEFCTKDPDVHGLTHCVGDIDAEICSAGASLSDERAFDGRLKGSLGDLISSISVLRVVSHRKVNGYPAS